MVGSNPPRAVSRAGATMRTHRIGVAICPTIPLRVLVVTATVEGTDAGDRD
jgi:hypothetical protein